MIKNIFYNYYYVKSSCEDKENKYITCSTIRIPKWKILNIVEVRETIIKENSCDNIVIEGIYKI